ncbi:hypothetical protein PMSD_15020 [Paenibacillus macquariensis subsp. defensor]|nr:hypothetical protein PMSD_15020 [Paenibacillus macquariensis subsp. defensor]
MMGDLERKLLRIMCNFKTTRYRIPEMRELEIKTGKTAKDITISLTELEEQRYIWWEDKTQLSGIVILEDSDRDGVTSSSTPVIQNDITYWTT